MVSEQLPLTRFSFKMATSPKSVFINNETTFVTFNASSQLPSKSTSINFPL